MTKLESHTHTHAHTLLHAQHLDGVGSLVLVIEDGVSTMNVLSAKPWAHTNTRLHAVDNKL